MIVLRRRSGYKEDPTRYFNFERFSKIGGDFVLVEAAFEEDKLWNEYGLNEEQLKEMLTKKIIRLEFEDPNKFYIGDNPDHYDHYFYKIFTIDPYTADFLNQRQGNDKHIPIFFPFNEEYIPKKQQRKFDIIYTGHIVSNILLPYLRIISHFNYCFASDDKNNYVTHRKTSYTDKLDLIAQSRISLIHNLQFPKIRHLVKLWRVPNFKQNQAFNFVPPWYNPWQYVNNKKLLVPQLKSRLFEAAFCRSLILCRRDPFNVIERFFEPAKEFVYFDDDNLEETIQKILKNYEDYQQIIENAYQRAINNYTVTKFFEKYLMNI